MDRIKASFSSSWYPQFYLAEIESNSRSNSNCSNHSTLLDSQVQTPISLAIFPPPAGYRKRRKMVCNVYWSTKGDCIYRFPRLGSFLNHVRCKTSTFIYICQIVITCIWFHPPSFYTFWIRFFFSIAIRFSLWNRILLLRESQPISWILQREQGTWYAAIHIDTCIQ